jgi:hypothetical protein
VEISGLYPEKPEDNELFHTGNLFFNALSIIVSKTQNLTLTDWCPKDDDYGTGPFYEIETLETLTLCVDQEFDYHGWVDIFGTTYLKTLKIQRGKLFRPIHRRKGDFRETEALYLLLDSDEPEEGLELSQLETLVLEDCEFRPDWKNDDGNINKLFEDLFEARPTLREIHLIKNNVIKKFRKDNTNTELLPG